jgi:hypothetical protein
MFSNELTAFLRKSPAEGRWSALAATPPTDWLSRQEHANCPWRQSAGRLHVAGYVAVIANNANSRVMLREGPNDASGTGSLRPAVAFYNILTLH